MSERTDIVPIVRKMWPPCLDLKDNAPILTRSEKIKWHVISRKAKIELQVYGTYENESKVFDMAKISLFTKILNSDIM